jgi:TRAP-type uncharacterized transport system fused permease subunit
MYSSASRFSGISSCAIVGLTTSTRGNRPINWALMVGLHLALPVLCFGGIEREAIKLGIFGAVLVGTPLLMRAFHIRGRIGLGTVVESFETGAKYALAVGAAAASVGIVIGVVTLTGVGFKLSTIITGAAAAVAGGAADFLPAMLADTKTLTLLVALIMTGLVCILLGCGIPTTANYIIMVTVASPTLVLLGVQPLVAHFFVFYYGVLADITPPVALAAYAAAGMAGSDPFKTGNMAFRLGMAKALPVGPTNMLLKDIIAADPEWAKKAPVSPEAHRALYLPNWEVFNRNLKKGTDYWNRVILK